MLCFAVTEWSICTLLLLPPQLLCFSDAEWSIFFLLCTATTYMDSCFWVAKWFVFLQVCPLKWIKTSIDWSVLQCCFFLIVLISLIYQIRVLSIGCNSQFMLHVPAWSWKTLHQWQRLPKLLLCLTECPCVKLENSYHRSCAFVLQLFAYPHWKSIGDGKKDKSLIWDLWSPC